MRSDISWDRQTDRRWGPFVYNSACGTYHPFGAVLSSGDDEDRSCNFRFSAFGRTLILALPPIVRPWKRKVVAGSWDAATVERLGRNWYWDVHRREYGFSYSDGFLSVALGRVTNDSSTEQRWSCFLPWTQWRHVRTSIYDLDGEHFWTEPPRSGDWKIDYDARQAAEEACPSATFAFTDFDGEALTAKTKIDEREWRFGEGWFRWLSIFRKPKIRRSLDISFSGETGKRKGSWKGGTVGHSIDMLSGELHESAFRRYCVEHGMKFIERVA